ncbi:DUF2577 family protein [Clostridium sp. BJN0001]|uniref:DUF2577 family protein n=1 Tax=Clostridium sp. BJN0001 TaxID=2930219 RepID=UPI001FD401A7|nr:DUF2577 family protein [Clostridium sp. BJN0001]
MYYVDLANELKKRNNSKPCEPTIGKVISISPLKISIFNGQVLLDGNIIELSNDFCILNGTCEVNGETGTCSIDRTIKQGEEVQCIPTNNGQKWFIAR